MTFGETGFTLAFFLLELFAVKKISWNDVKWEDSSVETSAVNCFCSFKTLFCRVILSLIC